MLPCASTAAVVSRGNSIVRVRLRDHRRAVDHLPGRERRAHQQRHAGPGAVDEDANRRSRSGRGCDHGSSRHVQWRRLGADCGAAGSRSPPALRGRRGRTLPGARVKRIGQCRRVISGDHRPLQRHLELERLAAIAHVGRARHDPVTLAAPTSASQSARRLLQPRELGAHGRAAPSVPAAAARSAADRADRGRPAPPSAHSTPGARGTSTRRIAAFARERAADHRPGAAERIRVRLAMHRPHCGRTTCSIGLQACAETATASIASAVASTRAPELLCERMRPPASAPRRVRLHRAEAECARGPGCRSAT